MNYKCFECGTAECIQHHHVVPRSAGGTKTIPLCSICHGKVHGIKRDNQINVSELTKEGIRKAKERGTWRSRPPKSRQEIEAHSNMQRKRGNRTAKKYGPYFEDLLKEEGSYRKAATRLNKEEVASPWGKVGSWFPAQIHRILKRYRELLEDK